MTIAEALTAERERRRLSVNELARRAGMTPSQALRVLNGATANPGVLTVAALLRALGKSMAWLEKRTNKFGKG